MLIQSYCLHLKILDKPRVDLMTEVLGQEHLGRTRVVGYNVTLKESRISPRKRKQHELLDLEDLATRLKESFFISHVRNYMIN